MDFTKIIPLIISVLSGTGPYAAIIQKVMEVIGLLLQQTGAPASSGMDVKWAQTALKQLGFDPGPIDGVMGAKTGAAVAAYQKARGMVVDGWLGGETQTKLALEVPPTVA